MFVVAQLGRMGNAMFQFAFGHALSRRLNAKWYLTDMHALRYFELGAYAAYRVRVGRILRKKSRAVARRAGLFKPEFVYVDELAEPEGVMAEAGDGVTYSGHFQSEKYFVSAQQEVREMFTVKRRYRNEFDRQYGRLLNQRPLLVIHIRRTDYVEYCVLGAQDTSLPAAYYRSAMEALGERDQYQCIFVGDDLDWAREHFGNVRGAQFLRGDPIADFQLLTRADALILSNSSFAWWGAYLNDVRQKVVVAPKLWLGFKAATEYPRGILAPDWRAIDVPTQGL